MVRAQECFTKMERTGRFELSPELRRLEKAGLFSAATSLAASCVPSRPTTPHGTHRGASVRGASVSPRPYRPQSAGGSNYGGSYAGRSATAGPRPQVSYDFNKGYPDATKTIRKPSMLADP